MLFRIQMKRSHYVGARHASPVRCLALLCLVMFWAIPCRAQLATSFYNVTGITATSLPNAVRLTIQTDGTVYFGGDQNDFINFDNTYQPKPVRSFRLRVLGARARLPAYVPIGQYPIDSASVSIAPATFSNPYYRQEAPQFEPHVDIELHFYVPVTVQRFTVRPNDYGLRFNDTLGPNDVAVDPSQDGQAIIITVFTDRADTRSAQNIKRSPVENQKHRLQVTDSTNASSIVNVPNAGEKHFRLDALHSPLSAVLGEVARVTGSGLFAAPEVADTDMSMLLPDATLPQFLDDLSRGYGMQIVPQEGGSFAVARGLSDVSNAAGANSSTGNATTNTSISASGASQELPLQRFSLKYLQADRARSLLPDFLLPAVRVDEDNNALLVSASSSLAQKIGDDLAVLDKPRAQVRVEADLWEFSSSDDANLALQTVFAGRNFGANFDSQAGSLAIRLDGNRVRQFAATLQALGIRGRVRLRAKPFLVVASGEHGTLFLGQTRYVTIFDGYQVNALQLQVGTSLEVTPRAGAGDQISLDLHPRFSTVDNIDSNTHLPTLGIREFYSSNTLQNGEQILIAGLDSDLNARTRSRGALTFDTTQRNHEIAKSILLVTASKTS